jgi:hypothetical protein
MTLSTEQVVEAVTFLTYIQELFSSNLSQDTEFSELSVASLSSCRKIRG